MTYKNIDNLTILRKSKSLSQQEVAKKMNVSQVTISMWESGKTYPTVPTIYKLAKLFGEPAEVVFKSFPIKEDV